MNNKTETRLCPFRITVARAHERAADKKFSENSIRTVSAIASAIASAMLTWQAIASGWKNRKSCDIISPSSKTARKACNDASLIFGADELQNRSHL